MEERNSECGILQEVKAFQHQPPGKTMCDAPLTALESSRPSCTSEILGAQLRWTPGEGMTGRLI
jgi:hypothetical protein